MESLGLPEIFMVCIFLSTFVFWVWMLIDCLTNEASGSEKIAWTLVILFGGCVGPVIYFFVRRSRRMQDY